ncbi:MAG: prepilin-type N-terminal cleavage/methylation domain-containing protein [SAR324 cluster bacterium]|nr:prepilin-type N-terminal cleavage/methylation domain-containing protein [SAR324 cluster bacterium]
MNGKREFYFNLSLEMPNFYPQFRLHFSGAGFTLLEVMIALAVLSVLVLTLQSPLDHFHRFIFNQQIESDRTMSVQRAQLLMKAELVQAGFGISSSDPEEAIAIENGTLTFKADLNLDGDLNDAREKISYRFDEKRQMLLRKSGRGAYQRFVEGLRFLSFAYSPSGSGEGSRLCIRITTRVWEQTDISESLLCPLKL